MVPSTHWSNVFISGDVYVGWLPSDKAKRQQQEYENRVRNIVDGYQDWTTSFMLLRAILQRWPKKVVIRPADKALFEKCEAVTWAKKPQDAAPAAAPTDCKNGSALGSNKGSDVNIQFSPWMFDPEHYCRVSDNRDPDEPLFHELVHAMEIVCGEMEYCPDHATAEFNAILITNVYSSQTRRAAVLMDPTNGTKTLADDLRESKKFYDQYRSQVDAFAKKYEELALYLKRSTAIQFNPFIHYNP